SKSVQPSPWMRLISSSLPTKSAPASFALATLSPWQKTSTRTDLPTPCGSETLPRIIWSDCVASMPSDMWTSTVSSNLARLICFRSDTAFFSGAAPSLASRCWMFFSWLRSFLPRRGARPARFRFFVGSPALGALGAASALASGFVSALASAGCFGSLVGLAFFSSAGLGGAPSAGGPLAASGAGFFALVGVLSPVFVPGGPPGFPSANPRGLLCQLRPTPQRGSLHPSLRRRANMRSALDSDAEAAGGPLDDAGRVIKVAGVEVLQFPLRDLAHLGGRHLEALVLAALLGLLLGGDDLAALLLLQRDAGGLLQKHRSGRALDHELETAVRVDGDDHRHGDAAHVLGAVVELRHELADVHPVLAQRRAYRRGRRRLTSRHLQANLGRYL